MPSSCKRFTSEQISRYVDNELTPELSKAIADHKDHCPACSQLIQTYQQFSDTFSTHVNQQAKDMRITSVSNEPEQKTAPKFNWLFGKNIYLKLASIVAIVVISLVAVQGRFTGPAGPSAIVQSVDTDVASVMIIETEKQKHTIIWISET